jgi:hypothetical protein
MALQLARSGLSAHERVLAGIAYLDRHHKGWRSNLDRGTLDIASNCDCAWAQGSGTYDFNGTWIVSEQRLKQAADLGFYAYAHGTRGAAAEYRALTTAWLDALAAEDAIREEVEAYVARNRFAQRAYA